MDGFRFIIKYKNDLYAVPYIFDGSTIIIYKSTNGVDWESLDTGIKGNNTRAPWALLPEPTVLLETGYDKGGGDALRSTLNFGSI